MRLSGEATRYATIHKDVASFMVPPNLANYQTACSEFTWDSARKGLSGLPHGKGLNIAYEAVDRHAHGPSKNRVALRWIGKTGQRRDYTYETLASSTNKFANLLRSLGVMEQDRVFILLGRVPELYVAILGALKNKCVVSPLFSAFGPEPIATRMEIGEARVLVTTESLYWRKIDALRERLPELEHVILIDADKGKKTHSWSELMKRASPEFEIPPTDPQDTALLHFTSGTTGRPKGVLHVHEAVVTHYATGLYALDLHENDRFWCTADPGWVTGTSYGVIAPLVHCVTNVVVETEFDAPTWYGILAQERVSVWYTAPTAIRMMMKLGAAAPKDYDLSVLRFAASVGEPLNAEAVVWGMEAFGLPFHDNWWQTETGGIMIANYASMDIKPGSMGRPLPGLEVAIIRRTANGGVEKVDAPGEQGELALKSGWPSMMRGYLHEEARYRKCFAGEWYLTGDLAHCDADGYFWFVGRADDVIKSSGHLIGPFEVESALMEHPAVAEVGVIGKLDPIAGEIVKAFVALKIGFVGDEAMRKKLLGHARKRLGAAVAPKEIEFRANLPKTRSGKIMRRLLKARELGLPEGDISTLESDER